MWFKKPKPATESVPYPGVKASLDGHGAVYAVETMASDSIVIHDVPDFAEITGPLRNLSVSTSNSESHILIRQVDQLDSLAAMTTGYALMGLRTAMLTSSLRGIREQLYAAAGKRLTCVINLTCRAVPRQAGAMHGGHDDYHDVAAAGWFQMFASNAQEVADFTLIAHRIAELSLIPGICAQDFYRTSHSVQNVQLAEAELVSRYLGQAEELINSPTPAQTLLFGQQRRRIPVLLDRDRPAGVGGVQDRDSYFKAMAAQRPFFYDHLEAIVATAMTEFGKLTGRHYNNLSGYRTDDAEILVIAQGAVFEELQAVVDILRDEEGIKAGVIKLTMLRPFPGAQLTYALKGKKAVTVLERTDQPLAEDLPLIKEIRSALDKALENGRSNDKLFPYPSYEAYHQISDRPQMFSAIYGVGSEIPAVNDLVAVYRNMLAGDGNKKFFYVGPVFQEPDRRFPHLQTLQQKLNKDYPDLQRLSLSGDQDLSVPEQNANAVEVHFLSSQGGIFAGNLFAQTLANALNWNVRTFPKGGLELSLQPASITILHSQEDGALRSKPVSPDSVLLSAYKLIENLPLLSSIKKGGTLMVESNRSPEALWHGLSRRMQQLVHNRSIKVYVINTQQIASETASNQAFIDQLAVWALLGAYLKTNIDLSGDDRQGFLQELETALQQLFGAGHLLISEIIQSMNRGAEELFEIPWQSWKTDEQALIAEAASPWTLNQATQADNNVFDVTRFWHSVGYFYDSGQPEQTLTDPYLATGILPAASSAFRDISPYRLRLPDWLPENCNACGLCWAVCPESALPPTVESLSSMIQSVVTECEAQGDSLIQIKRILDPLLKQCYRLVLKDDLNQYLTMGPLLTDAFAQLIEKMNIADDKLEEIRQEFAHIQGPLEHFKVAKTEAFFEAPHKEEKNSGMLLSIALNPLSCTGCGLCIETCPEHAFDWTDQTPERLNEYHHNWQQQLKLPGLARDQLDKFVSDNEAQTQLNRLLNSRAYHSMVGGDGASPGNSVKTAVHLLTATTESVMQPRFETHIKKLTELIEGLEEKIQGRVASTLSINDFENFTQRLSKMDSGSLSAEQLATMVNGKGDSQAIDQIQLQRQSELLVKLQQQRQLYRQGAGGSGRARMLLTIDPSASPFWSGTYPYNPHAQPWICHLPGDAPVLAECIFEGLARILAQEIKHCRCAELELTDSYVSEQHGPLFEKINWRDFSDQEKQLMPPVLVICQSGNNAWQGITRLLASDYPIKIAMINREGLSVPESDNESTTDQAQPHRTIQELSPAMLTLAQPGTFIVQTTVGHPGHLVQGIAESLDHEGPALLHIYAPDPQGCGIATEKVIEQASLAYQSRAFPLFKIKPQPAATVITLDENPMPESDWTTREYTIHGPSGRESTLSSTLTLAHWAARESRFRQHFKILAKGHLTEQMKPLVEYMDLELGKRDGLEPYVDFVTDNQQHFVAVVSTAMVAASESARDGWRQLQKLAVGDQTKEEAVKAEPVVIAEPPPPPDLSAHQGVTARLLDLCGYSQDPAFFKRSLRDFIVRGNQAQDKQAESDHVESGD